MSLLGITPQVPTITFDNTGVTTYTAATQTLHIDAAPMVFKATTSSPPRNVTGTKDFVINIQVDNTGQLVGGVAGDDLVVTGNIDINGDGTVDVSGTLLTGEVSQFGFLDDGPDTYDFRFTPTGGALRSYFIGKDIGIVATSNNSTFANDFSVDFQGGAKGTMGTVAPWLSSLAGNVYSDANNNGLLETGLGETGIAGVGVALTGTDIDGVAVNLLTNADANGAYSFTNLRPGTYTITETQPAGYLDGTDAVGSQGGTLGNDILSDITLAAGVAGTDNNFGELAPASLAGNVYEDANNDGVMQTGELGIANVAITLSGTDDLGAVNLSTNTDANGAYSFANLRPGTYVITETQPAGLLDGTDAVGSQGGTLGNDILSDITLAAGVAGTDNNFGELAPASLAGYVYVDMDNDGIKELGELGVPGAAITLTGTDDLGAVNLSTNTDANGAYSFTNLRPGTYVITETQPAGLLDGTDAVGSQGGTLGNDVISDIVLAAGVSGVDNNFGELFPPPALSSLSGFVYVDDNNDGIMEDGELGIPGVTVTLSGTDDLGAPVNLSTTTDDNGAYSFMDLSSGTYVITETQPAGYVDGQDAVGTQGGTLGNDVISEIYLAAGVDGTGNNFGELPQPQLPASLSGFVYIDTDNDGIKQAGESGIAGVTVILSGTNYLGQSVLLTTTTDANGAYSFTDLLPGTYKLRELQPGSCGCGCWGAWICQWWQDGGWHFGNPGCGSGSGGGCSNSGLLDSLFGAMINHQWLDEALDWDDEGLCDALFRRDDPNSLFDPNDADTNCFSQFFSDFWNGCHVVYGLDGPSCYLDGKDTIGTQGGVTGNDVFSNIVLDWNVNGTDNNFGELQPASLSGSVYVDANDDGIRQCGEKGIARVKVILTGTNDLGNTVRMAAMTDCRGNYEFDNLRPGTYTVTEISPACYLDGKDAVGTQGGTLGNDVLSDIVLASGVQGTGNTFGELKSASLSGFVFVDKNGDGDIDCTDVAIADATVTLTGVDDLGNAVSVTTQTDEDGFYLFKNLRPGTYAITETQPAGYLDGVDTIGSQGGTVGNDQFTNIVLNQGVRGVNNNFSERLDTSAVLHEGQTATIGFWNNKRGQALIKSLNGGCNAKALGNWLATNFNNMYGADAGVFNLAGKTNAQIASFFQQLFSVRGMKVDAQALAVALACYVTDVDLAGTVAASYGFVVNAAGTAAATYNIGNAGAAFGVANNTQLTILEILQRTNDRARNGILWDTDGNGCISWAEQVLRTLGNNVFTGINETGDIA